MAEVEKTLQLQQAKNQESEATEGGISMPPPQFKLAASASDGGAGGNTASKGGEMGAPIQKKDDPAKKPTKETWEGSNAAAANIGLVMAEWASLGDKDNRKLAYILATIEHECGFRSKKEKKQVSAKTDAQKALIETQGKYWDTGFYGRGFVQLTWENNYKKMGPVVGEDLVANPDLAMDPKNAAKISVYGMIHGSFTGVSLSTYFKEGKTDYVNARKIINGTDRAADIAKLAEAHFTRLSGEDKGAPHYESIMNLADKQQVLKDLGFLKGTVDGSGGPDTNQAILQFKAKYSLPNPKSTKLDATAEAKFLELQTASIGSAKSTAGTLKDAAPKTPATSAGAKAGAIAAPVKDQPAASKPKETAESIFKGAKGNYPAIGKILAGKLTSNPQVVREMFNYISWINTDDMAYYITLSASNSVLAATDKKLLQTMYDNMDGMWTTSEEYKMMDKLKPYLGAAKPITVAKPAEKPAAPAPTVSKAPVTKAPAAKAPADKAPAAKDSAVAAPSPTAAAGNKKYVVSDGVAYIRNDKFEKVEGDKTIPKWTEVVVTKTANSGKSNYSYVTSVDGKTTYGWTSSSNLYIQDWKASDDEAALKGVSSSYYDMIAANDPASTRKDTILSGKAAKANIDKYYPNQTDPKYLDKGFKAKLDLMLASFKTNGITAVANAGLRHPMRSVVFNYSIAVGNASSEDKIHEANAVCTKYGIPIDWAHKKADGTIDLALSKKKALELKAAFGIKGKAARGVTDFGGTISNHNHGKAVDLSLSFSFSKAKTVTVGGQSYTINPGAEVGDVISDVKNTPLSKLGKEQFGITRALNDDTVHWSYSGR